MIRRYWNFFVSFVLDLSLSVLISVHPWFHLHFFGRFDSEQLQRAYQLEFNQAAQLEKERLLGVVLFREDAMVVIKKIERLGELERVLRDEGGFLRVHRGFDLRAKRSREQDHFPNCASTGVGEGAFGYALIYVAQRV